jgi:hypothetical protein
MVEWNTFTGEVPEGVVVPQRVVRVWWRDAKSYGEWMCQEQIAHCETELCETRGFLVGESEAAICVAQTKGEDYGFHNIFVIPRGCVLEITEVD